MKKNLLIVAVLMMCVSMVFTAFAVPTAVDETSDAVADVFADTAVGNSAESIVGYAPEETITVKDMMAVAVRLHSTLNNGGVSAEYNEDTYYAYAVNNGIVANGVNTEAEDKATRRDVVYTLYNASKGKVDFSEISPLVYDYIPDAEVTAYYYEAALKFIEAGIVEGADEYGTFKPGSDVKRYELGLMIDRILNAPERVAKDYIKYAGDAPFYLIDDFIMQVPVVNVSNIASGWRYDYTGSVEKGVAGAYKNNVTDLSLTDNITISRTIEPQSDGVLELETNFNINYGFASLEFQFVDSDGNIVYRMGTTGTDKFFNGEITNATSIAKADREIPSDTTDSKNSIKKGRTMMRITLDVDEGTADVYVAGIKVGETFSIGTIKDVAELRITTGKEERLEAVINQLHLYKNWHVNDLMRTTMPGNSPLGYETSGNVTVEYIESQADNQGDNWSAKFVASAGANSFAKRDFKAISGLAIMETYMLLPTGDDGAYFTVTSDGVPVIKVETQGNKFKSGNEELITFSDNIWQLIRIEANTYTQTYSVRIRGKLVAENLPFLVKASHFDGLEIGITPASDCVMWFDDVEAYETFEYDDYCPEPVVVENDYLVGMSICNLWRNGSHYGWSYIQPHHEPITGFYDEGIPEAMDWEIKMLAEHGFDFYNFCWYSTQNSPKDPLKKSRMNDAIHDGYFNAKYSDKLKISLMFENASMRTAGTWDEFEQNVWPYWKEWYFSDPRYFTIEEDGKTYTFLTIYQYQYFLQMCNDTQVLSDKGGLDSATDITEAAKIAAQKIKWMSDDLKASGISDGLIVGVNHNLQRPEDARNIAAMFDSANGGIGLDYVGVFPYTWGSVASDLDTQLAYIERGYEAGSAYNLDLLALPCIGFNKIGWYHEENYDLIANEDLKTLLNWFKSDYLTRYKNDAGSWKQKYIQFATWNEFGEGHYFYPCDDNGGYAYLNTMAEVLSGDNAGAANDTIPTEAQKDRIGHLYVGDRMFIRRNYTDIEHAPEVMTTTLQYTFNPGTTSSTNYFSGWTLSGATQGTTKSSCTYHSSSWGCRLQSSKCTYNYTYDGILTTTNTDPMMYRSASLSADDCDVLFVTLEASKPYTTGEFFFISDDINLDGWNITSSGTRAFTQDYSYSFDILSTGKVTYEIDLRSHDGWKGNITSIRFDLGSINGNTVKVYDIRFAKYDDSVAKPSITIDNIPYKTTDYGEIRSWSRDELFIAPAESENLYRLLHVVYDWHKDTGILKLTTPYDDVVVIDTKNKKTTFNGAVRSDYPVNNGEWMYDGVPVIPLKWILDNCGYNYVYDFTNKTLDITVVDKVVYHNVANFNAEGTDTNAFYTQNSNTSMTIVTDPYNSSNKVWQHNSHDGDFNYIRTNFEFEKGTTYIIDLDARLCPELSDGSTVSSADISFNARYADTALEANKYDHNPSSARATLTTEWKHVSFVYTVADTIDQTSSFQQQISFYIAPYDYGGKNLGINYQVDNLRVRTAPKAFRLLNGDAEGDNTNAWYSNNANVTIETESNGNKYIHVEHSNDASAWNYLRQKTTFEAGVTYYFSFDFRLGKGKDGSDVTTTVNINPRYKDLLMENASTNVYDHNFNFAGNNVTISTSDTWTNYKGSFTVSMGHTPGGVNGGYDEITFFANPVNGNTVPVHFDLDNFVVSTKYEDIFG